MIYHITKIGRYFKISPKLIYFEGLLVFESPNPNFD